MSDLYDASQVTVTIQNQLVTGFKKGTFVNAAKTDNNVAAESNAFGEVAWSITNSKLGSIVLTLNQTSPWCAKLNALAEANTVFPIWVNDPISGETRGGTEALIEKISDATFSDTNDARAYTIQVGNFAVKNS